MRATWSVSRTANPGSGVRRALLLLACALCACSGLVSKAGSGLSQSLSSGILDSDDPETVAAGLPAYLILLDGLLSSDPKNVDLLLGASKLYAAYCERFRGRGRAAAAVGVHSEAYARRAVCERDRSPLRRAGPALRRVQRQVSATKDIALLHGLALAWAGAIQADSSNYDRIAALPKVQLLLVRVTEIDPNYDHGSSYMYLGVLDCLRPEAYGGKPDQGKAQLERAFQLSQSKSVMPLVLEAQYCARLTFDQEAHDRLLNQALAADARAPGLTLGNILAQRKARELLESGKDYF
jgi:hypothetical protein